MSPRAELAHKVDAGGGERLRYAGMAFVIRASAASTGGAFSIVEEIDALDAPLHIHDQNAHRRQHGRQPLPRPRPATDDVHYPAFLVLLGPCDQAAWRMSSQTKGVRDVLFVSACVG